MAAKAAPLQHIFRDYSQALLKTLKDSKATALIAFSSKNLIWSDAKKLVAKVKQAGQEIGYRINNSQEDSKILAELRNAKDRFKKQYSLTLKYVMFSYTRDAAEAERLSKLAEKIGLVSVGHNLDLSENLAKAKKQLQELFVSPSDESYIALVNGNSADPDKVIEALKKTITQRSFQLTSFSACVSTSTQSVPKVKAGSKVVEEDNEDEADDDDEEDDDDDDDEITSDEEEVPVRQTKPYHGKVPISAKTPAGQKKTTTSGNAKKILVNLNDVRPRKTKGANKNPTAPKKLAETKSKATGTTANAKKAGGKKSQAKKNALIDDVDALVDPKTPTLAAPTKASTDAADDTKQDTTTDDTAAAVDSDESGASHLTGSAMAVVVALVACLISVV